MPAIKTLEDLDLFRKDIVQKQKERAKTGMIQVIVGMGTCGIAAGASDTMDTILETIKAENLQNVEVTQTGCIGLCEKEPIVEVVIGAHPKVTYGKVTPEIARKILLEHVKKGEIVKSNIVQS